MTDVAPNVVVIPANPELARRSAAKRQLRVAAYCRVSTNDEEQLTSYEAQKTYYTDKIMTNPEWTMAGIFADEGISGVSTAKRTEFNRMIRHCRQGKIDVVMVKSISRFARNTLDCIKYIRALKTLGVAVIFEKESINTLEMDSELLLTMMGAFAQAESESMGANVRWGMREAMRSGKANLRIDTLYAYEKGEDGKPKIIPEQAEVVRRIYERFLAGQSLRMIRDSLEKDGVVTIKGQEKWNPAVIKSILTNEKYCGDVLRQKTFIEDTISKKVKKNTGQLPMYLIQNHHEGIVSREMFNAAQAELARRNAGKAPSQKQAPTGKAKYSAKYALSDRLVCGECGSLHRRCVWTHHGQHRAVWRCISRIDYGTRYCHNAPTIDEKPLQDAILAAINSVMSRKEALVGQIADAMRMELLPSGGETLSIGDIERLIEKEEKRFGELFASVKSNQDFMARSDEFKAINETLSSLKSRKAILLERMNRDSAASWRVDEAIGLLSEGNAELTEWDEGTIRQLVDTVKVISKEKILVTLQGGVEIKQDMV
ncbi:MAG: recombinase family protein [Oscillospiraceae bacterium]|nr:recombinase family protein [Oscillospiraceae bacterium]